MPEMDGPAVSRKIYEIYSESEHVTIEQRPHICCCTAYTDDEFRKKALASGMD